MAWERIIIHATVLLVAGFFVAFAAQKAEGCLKRFGRYLACWLYLLAAVAVVMGAVFTYYHGMSWGYGGYGYGGYGHGYGGYGGGMSYHGGNYPVPAPAPAPGATPTPEQPK